MHLFIETKSRRSARRVAAWAAVVAQCEGGFLAFASTPDYRTWKRQR